MNNNDKKNLGISWFIAIEATAFGFLINIAGSALYSILDSGITLTRFAILIIFGLIGIFFANLLTYMIDNIDLLREEEMTFRKLIWGFIKSFKK